MQHSKDSLNLQFIYAYPLDNELRRSFEEREQVYPMRDEIRDVMKRWKTIWQTENEQHSLLEKLSQITKRVPERNLECFIFGRGLSPKSTPFMIPIWNRKQEQWSDEKFIDLMIHELLHIFLVTDNDSYWELVRKKYHNEELVTQNHILLYAMLYQLYQDIWNTEPMDFSRDNLPPGYARAIEMVKEIGYKELISEYDQFTAEKSVDASDVWLS
ncbi:hypothetical protein KC850_00420 [Candidatus Kaiserbacteria bacterium]|nr:hypothetical protein [Candidatus Kaiserbacteria bacterium]